MNHMVHVLISFVTQYQTLFLGYVILYNSDCPYVYLFFHVVLAVKIPDPISQ